MTWEPQTGSERLGVSHAHPEDCECFERCRRNPDEWQVYDEVDMGPAHSDADGRL